MARRADQPGLPTAILSAVSADQITWSMEAGDPVHGARWRRGAMLFHAVAGWAWAAVLLRVGSCRRRSRDGPRFRVISATTTDGITFERDPGCRLAGPAGRVRIEARHHRRRSGARRAGRMPKFGRMSGRHCRPPHPSAICDAADERRERRTCCGPDWRTWRAIARAPFWPRTDGVRWRRASGRHKRRWLWRRDIDVGVR